MVVHLGRGPRTTITAGAVLLLGVVASTALAIAPADAASGRPSARQLSQARSALLVRSDLPSGWRSAKSDTSASNVGNAQLARCIGVTKALVAENPPEVTSPQFQNSDGTLTVNDSVTVFPSSKNADAELAIASNAKTPGCMTRLASGPLKSKLFGKLPKGVSIGTPLVSPTSPSAFGPSTPGFSMSVPITTRGVTVNLTVTQLFAVKGVLGQQVTFTSIGTAFSIPLEQQIASVAFGRL